MATSLKHPFHLAFPVNDLTAAEKFYAGLLQCPVGRRSDRWIDFNFHGHQIVAHLTDELDKTDTNQVDGEQVPARHFGVILEKSEWEVLAARIQETGLTFLIAPSIRFAGEVGEQGIFFINDPSGNALEFKYFIDSEQIFRT